MAKSTTYDSAASDYLNNFLVNFLALILRSAYKLRLYITMLKSLDCYRSVASEYLNNF